jgi:hypothetical protein
MCANQGMEDSGWGVRFLRGVYADVFLQRSGVVRGYAVAIWKHQHVAEPTQLPAGHPLPFDFLDNQRQPEDRLLADALALRSVVDSPEP